MVAQLLHKAGLFLGERLVPPDISNPDGHFEDRTVVDFHDSVLNRHGLDWRVTSPDELTLTPREKRRMKDISRSRDARYTTWGVKDPRMCLFLADWLHALSNPVVVCVYRHYIPCYDSLVRRHAVSFTFNPTRTGMNLAFGLVPELGFQLWKEYNGRLLKFLRDHPDRAIVLGHQILLDGAPLSHLLNSRFGLELDAQAPSGVNRDLIGSQWFKADFVEPRLKTQMDEIWHRLESVSWRRTGLPGSSERHLDDAAEVVRTQELLRSLKQPADEIPVIHNAPHEETSASPDFSPAQPECVLHRARQLVHDEEISTAILLLETAVEHSPLHGILLTELADLYHRMNRYADAEIAYYRAIAVEPCRPQVLARLGLSLAGQGRLSEAEHHIRRALGLNPRNPWFFRELASILARRERLDEALEVIAKGREAFPDDVNILAQQVSLLRDVQRTDEAIRLCLHALYNHPNAPQLFMEAYKLLASIGRPAEGDDFYYRARRLQIVSNILYEYRLQKGLASIQHAGLRTAYRHIVNNTLESVLERGTSFQAMKWVTVLRNEIS